MTSGGKLFQLFSSEQRAAAMPKERSPTRHDASEERQCRALMTTQHVIAVESGGLPHNTAYVLCMARAQRAGK